MDVSKRMELLRQTGALLNGHFLLRSGLHSDRYFQAALVFQWPKLSAAACAEMAGELAPFNASTVIAPALGGVVFGYELARCLGLKSIFVEKDDQGKLVLRRGFEIAKGERVIVAEDVVTKGGRASETVEIARSFGAEVVAVAVVVDRSGGTVDFGVPLVRFASLDLPTFEPTSCPLCASGVLLVKPGSK